MRYDTGFVDTYLCMSDWNPWADRSEGCGSGRVGRG